MSSTSQTIYEEEPSEQSAEATAKLLTSFQPEENLSTEELLNNLNGGQEDGYDKFDDDGSTSTIGLTVEKINKATTTLSMPSLVHGSTTSVATGASPASNTHTSSSKMSVPISPSTVNHREMIRARLREKEKRLSSLMKSSSIASPSSSLAAEQLQQDQQQNPNGDASGNSIAVVQANLKQVEAEKIRMEQELARLKLQISTDQEDDFLKERMCDLQAGFEKQLQNIQSLELTCRHHEEVAEQLRQNLHQKLRQIVELEFDLETHAIHYTAYASEQFKLGEEALAELKAMQLSGDYYTNLQLTPKPDEDHDCEASVRSTRSTGSRRSTGNSHASSSSVSGVKKAKKTSPRKAQKLISKLLSDLDNLESRYKDAQLDFNQKIQILTEEKGKLQVEVHLLKERLEKQERQNSLLMASSTTTTTTAGEASGTSHVTSDKTSGEDSGETKSATFLSQSDALAALRKKLEFSEARRSLQRVEMEKMSLSLMEKQNDMMQVERKSKLENDKLRMENEAMKLQLHALENQVSILQQQQQENTNHNSSSRSLGLILGKKRRERKQQQLQHQLQQQQGSTTATSPSFEKDASSRSLSLAGSPATAAYAAAADVESATQLHTCIRESYDEIIRLRAMYDIQERQLNKMRKEVTVLRMKEIAAGDIDQTLYTAEDTQLIQHMQKQQQKEAAILSSLPHETGDTISSTHLTGDEAVLAFNAQRLLRDMQAQLHDVQQQLVKKDQELVIERAKSASTTAGLLARIGDLTKKQKEILLREEEERAANNKLKKKGQDQVPLRFYL